MNLTEYFKKNTYVPKYEIGARIYGTWNKIPFIGTISNDTYINPDVGPELHIHLDLPLKYKGVYHNILAVSHRQVKFKLLK